MTELDRRSFLKTSAAVAGGAALAGPFQGLLAGLRRSPTTPCSGRSRTCGTRRSACTCRRASATARSTTPSTRSTRSSSTTAGGMPGRHDGMAAFAGRGDDVDPGAQPRGGRAGVDASRWTSSTYVRPERPRRDHHRACDQATASRRSTPIAQPRPARRCNCSGGPMPWGSWITCEETVNGPDVGDDFTRIRGHWRAPPRPLTYIQNGRLAGAARLHLRGADQRRRRRPSRSPGPGGSPTRRSRTTRRTATSTSTEDDFGYPVRLLPLPPAAPGRQARPDGLARPAADAGGQAPVPTPTSRSTRSPGRPTRSSGSTSTSPTSTPARRPPGAPPTMTNDEAISYVAQPGPGAEEGRRVLLPARGRDLRQRRRLLHLDPGRRAREADPTEVTDPSGFGQRDRTGLGLRHPGQAAARGLPVARARPTLDLPDNITTSPRGTLVLCEDNDAPTTCAACSQPGRPVRHRAEPADRQSRRADRLERRVRRRDVQPGRRDALRQHPGQPAACRSRSGARGSAIGV